ncbi:MAG: YggT family protein [Treponema sp.]|nr:YggT family protein [Treponema sp.]
MLQTILGLLSAFITIYTILCFIAIIITWIPAAKFTKFGRLINSITGPYLNFFSKRGWLRFGNIDFSPILAIGLLVLISSILGGIAASGTISVGFILQNIIEMFWTPVSSLTSIFILVMFIRWIVLAANKGQVSVNSAWYQVDLIFEKFVYKIGNTFFKTNLNYQKALLVSWISLSVILILAWFLVGRLIALCGMIPF